MKTLNTFIVKPFLSKREQEILIMILVGMATKEIAACLNLDIQTINTHRRRMMKKAHAKNIYGVVCYCLVNNLLDIEGLKTHFDYMLVAS